MHIADRPHGVCTPSPFPRLSSAGIANVSEWNMAMHDRDLPLPDHISSTSMAATDSYQSSQGSPILQPAANLNMSLPLYQPCWSGSQVVNSTPLPQPSNRQLGPDRLFQREPTLSTLQHTTSAALKLQSGPAPVPGSRQENYTLTQCVVHTDVTNCDICMGTASPHSNERGHATA